MKENWRWRYGACCCATKHSRRNLGVAARDTILEGFTLAHQAEKLKRIYRESAA